MKEAKFEELDNAICKRVESERPRSFPSFLYKLKSKELEFVKKKLSLRTSKLQMADKTNQKKISMSSLKLRQEFLVYKTETSKYNLRKLACMEVSSLGLP